MIQILFGDRIGRQGKIRLGCAAVLFDEKHQNVLLTRRADNGQWCLPSGSVEPGESVSEACVRETFEETGLQVQVKRFVSIYSSPDRLVIYADGNKNQFVILAFEVELVGGQLGISEETTAAGYYSLDELEQMDIFAHHRQFIFDAMENQDAVFIR